MEKIPGHRNEMRKFALGSVAFVRFRTDSAKAPTLIFDRLTRKQEVERIAMSTRRRFKQVICLKDRLIQEAQSLRKQAAEMPHGDLRDELLMKARHAETAAHMDDWLASNRSQYKPPTGG
jgi:hypothetical protein